MQQYQHRYYDNPTYQALSRELRQIERRRDELNYVLYRHSQASPLEPDTPGWRAVQELNQTYQARGERTPFHQHLRVLANLAGDSYLLGGRREDWIEYGQLRRRERAIRAALRELYYATGPIPLDRASLSGAIDG
jgi:hypothetical protein